MRSCWAVPSRRRSVNAARQLRNALKALVDESELTALGIDAGTRPERLEIRDYVALANYLARRPDDSG